MKEMTEVFKMSTLELIGYKSSLLDELAGKKEELLSQKFIITEKESKLLLETDFKELKLTNEKMRTAYVNNELLTEKKEAESLKLEISKIENQIIIIDDIVNLLNLMNFKGE